MSTSPTSIVISEDTQRLIKQPILKGYDLKHMSDEQKEIYHQDLQNGIIQLHAALENLLVKISGVSGVPERDLTRESNTRRIQFAIEQLMRGSTTMPTQMQIAAATGLSRNTIQKYMEEIAESRKETTKQYSLMASQVMYNVLRKAIRYDDLRASKMYLDYALKFGNKEDAPTFVMLDNQALTQNMINDLEPHQKQFLLVFLNNLKAKEKKELQ